jgi:hypothetical protein
MKITIVGQLGLSEEEGTRLVYSIKGYLRKGSEYSNYIELKDEDNWPGLGKYPERPKLKPASSLPSSHEDSARIHLPWWRSVFWPWPTQRSLEDTETHSLAAIQRVSYWLQRSKLRRAAFALLQ